LSMLRQIRAAQPAAVLVRSCHLHPGRRARSLSGLANTVLRMRGDYFRPLTETMLNFAYFSPILSAA
jgi:hypothetical protein